jgi:transposase-like protein
MRPAYADRPRLKARILDRLSKGVRMHRIGEQPGLPSPATVRRWAKADENFRFNLAHARMEGAQVRRIARRSPAWHPGVAEEFLARVRGGEWVGDLVRTYGMPHRAALDRWRRERPEFAQALSEAVRAAGPRRRRRASIYSEDVADKVIQELARGVPVRRLRAEAGLPCEPVLRAWRRAHPEFDHAVRTAIHWGHRARMKRRRGSLADRREAILEALFCGATLQNLRNQPGMPHAPTLYGWMKRDPTFAAEVRWACEQRDYFRAAEPTPRQLRRMWETG